MLPVDFYHDFDPYLFESIGLTWYLFAYIEGILLGLLSAFWIKKQLRIQIQPKQLLDLCFFVSVGAVYGGKFGYALLYDYHVIFRTIDYFPYLEILSLGGSGRSFHGGFIGAILGCFLFAKKYRLQTRRIFDFLVIGAAIGVTFGRIGNFLNGELYGQVASSKSIIRVQFPSEIQFWPQQHPEKIAKLKSIFERLGIQDLENFPEKELYFQKEIKHFKSLIAKLKIPVQKESQFKNEIKKILPYRHPSQLYASILEGIVPLVVALIWLLTGVNYQPGASAALWTIMYSCMRFFVGFFREPDAHLGFQLLGLSRGQWLTITLGLFAIYFFRKWQRPCHP